MAGYAKIWTDIFNDAWFLSLSLTERGFWLQLIVYAKLVGDSGVVRGRSWAALGSVWGCDGKTCRKILGNFLDSGKVVRNNPDCEFEFEILNYKYWQGLTKIQVNPNARPIKENSKKIPSQPDQSRSEQIRSEQNIREDMSPDKSGSPRLQKFYQAVIQIDYSKYKDLGLSKSDYDFEIKKMAGWIETNPRKGNKSNYARFIHNWLIRRIEDGKQSKRGGREVDTFD